MRHVTKEVILKNFELSAMLDNEKNLTVTKVLNQSQGENNCTKITVAVPPDLADGFRFFLEFLCPQNKRYVSPQLENAGEENGLLLFSCAVPSCVLQEEGLVLFQLVARSKQDDGIVYKSVRANKTSFFVHPSVNACEQTYEATDYFANSNGAVAQEALLRENADNQLQHALDILSSAQKLHAENTENPHNVTKEQLNLGNVDNTADSEKRVKFATFAQCDQAGNDIRTTYAKLTDIPTSIPAEGGNADTLDGKHSSDFATAAQGAKAETAYQKPADGIPTSHLAEDVRNALALSQTAVQSLSGYATESFVKENVANLVNSAPEALDTLNELAAALGNDPDFAATISAELGKKANTEQLGSLAFKNSVTKTDVGLGNVDNTSDANKPVSVAQAAALAQKVDKEDGKVLSDNNFTNAEKTKLASIATSANNYALPVAGAELGGIKDGGDILVGTDGTVTVRDYSHDHKIENVWRLQEFLDGKAENTVATKTASGLMSSADKQKLDGIDENANNYVLPAASAEKLGGVTASADGDIDVDENGIVSVKDNSHTHLMTTVTGLTATLAEKVNLGTLTDYVKKTDETQDITAKSVTTKEEVSARDGVFDKVVSMAYYIGSGSTNLLVHTTGQSSIQAMSQKGFTQALTNWQAYLEQYVDDEINTQLDETVGDVNAVLDTINGEVI